MYVVIVIQPQPEHVLNKQKLIWLILFPFLSLSLHPIVKYEQRAALWCALSWRLSWCPVSTNDGITLTILYLRHMSPFQNTMLIFYSFSHHPYVPFQIPLYLLPMFLYVGSNWTRRQCGTFQMLFPPAGCVFLCIADIPGLPSLIPSSKGRTRNTPSRPPVSPVMLAINAAISLIIPLSVTHEEGLKGTPPPEWRSHAEKFNLIAWIPLHHVWRQIWQVRSNDRTGLQMLTAQTKRLCRRSPTVPRWLLLWDTSRNILTLKLVHHVQRELNWKAAAPVAIAAASFRC